MKKIKPILCFLFLFACLFIPIKTHTASAVYVTEPRVYITNYGDKYHSYDCQYLYDSKIAIGIYKAKDEGYSACVICGGKSSGTIREEYFSDTNNNDGSFYAPLYSYSIEEKEEESPSILSTVLLSGLLIAGGGITMAILGHGLNTLPIKKEVHRTSSIKFWGMFILTAISIIWTITLFSNGPSPWGYFLVEVSISLFSLTFLWDLYT